jgi:hypothetical protein
MKSLFLTSETLTTDLQTLDNLLVLKILDDKGYELPQDFIFEADIWGDHLLSMALNIIFKCEAVQIEVTKKTSNGTYQERMILLSLEGYDDWIRLKEKYPEMSEFEEDMCCLAFECEYTATQLRILFKEKGIVIDYIYEITYLHTLMDDFLTLKEMWVESLFFWRRKEFEENERRTLNSRMENHSAEKSHEISQCA